MSSKKTIIECRDMCKSYQTGKEMVPVLNNLNIEIYEGDFTVIMGNSGSGKSTFLYSVSGLDNVTGGKVIYDGKEVQDLKEKQMVEFRRKEIGFVFQAICLVPNFTVMENVSVPGFLCEKNKRKVVDRASRLLEMMELKSEMKRLPSQISGGQQQKVAIARGLINSPRILFADEPTGALNSKQGENVLDVMTRLNEQGQSIVMVTHDIKAACRANRILFLRDGVIDGVLELSLYTPEDEDRREQEIYEFIKKRGW